MVLPETTETTEALKPLDKCGREITEGDFVVYASQRGQSADLKFGRVVEVSHTVDVRYWMGVKQERVAWAIKVVGCDGSWNEQARRYNNYTLQKPSKLQFPERMVVIAARQLPADVQRLYGLDPLAIELEEAFGNDETT